MRRYNRASCRWRAAKIPKTTATEKKTARLVGCCHAASRKSRHATSQRRQLQGFRIGGRSFITSPQSNLLRPRLAPRNLPTTTACVLIVVMILLSALLASRCAADRGFHIARRVGEPFPVCAKDRERQGSAGPSRRAIRGRASFPSEKRQRATKLLLGLVQIVRPAAELEILDDGRAAVRYGRTWWNSRKPRSVQRASAPTKAH